MSEVSHYYWDTCIFVAHFNDARAAYGQLIDHIKQFLEEAQAGTIRIYCSTLTIAEVGPNAINPDHRDFQRFLTDFKAAIIPISPDPNIMALAAELRCLPYAKNG